MYYWNELIKKYKAGVSNCFILAGNIYDYVQSNVLLFEDLLLKLKDKVEDIQDILVYDCPNGLSIYEARDEKNIPKGETVSPFALIKYLSNANNTAIIIKYPEYFFGKNSAMNTDYNVYSMINLLTDRKFFTSSNMLIFISETISAIPKDLTSKMTLINIPYPSYEIRLNFIKKDIKNRTFKTDITVETIAKLTAGLTLLNIEDIFLLAEYEGMLDKELILQKKKEIIQNNYGDIIELFDVDNYNFDKFAGYEELKKYHREVIIDSLVNGDSSIVPKGLLYVGPPGTGKTYFAKCFAGEAKVNFVELKLSKILDKYVGESEKNFEKALNCISSLTPCGVFIDELDQAFQRGDGDNTGVRANIFGRLLNFISDDKNRGKIIFIGASNYPNNIDEALKRPGRFDKKIPFLPPDKNNRIKTFEVLFKKFNVNYKITNWDTISERTEGYTQAEIENVVVKAIEIMKRNKLNILTDMEVQYALNCIKRRNNEKIQEMINIALDEVDDLEFLPESEKHKYSLS